MKTSIGNTPYLYPIPIVLVGSVINGKSNFATVGDVAVMGLKPALMTISLNEKHLTTKGIIKTGKFSINIPTADMMDIVDYCGMYSGNDRDKTTLFALEKNKFDVPMIRRCPVSIACKVIEDVIIEHRHIFIAEVLGTYADEDYLQSAGGYKSIVGLEKLNPLMYGLDNKYYSIGKQIGIGYSEGKNFKK